MVRDNYIRELAVLLGVIAAATLVAMLVGTKPAEAAFPGANGKIVFASDRTTGTGVDNPTGDNEIFVMNPDRTGIEQLTFNTPTDFQPAWSEDGSWIAFASFRDGNFEIFMSSYGSNPVSTRRLTTNTAFDFEPAFNHDMSKIAFRRFDGTNHEIYVMDTTDSNPSDGNGDNQTNLTEHPAGDAEPVFSPEGTKIAFYSDRDGQFEVYVMDADGTDPVNLSNHAASDFDPAWSPDGSKIAFASNRAGNNEIYVMNADGTEQKRLTKKAADDVDPAFSPDGTKIAFQSRRGGGDEEIYVMKAKPESRKNRPKNLTKNDAVEDTRPDWQPIP